LPSLQCAALPPSARQSSNWRRTRDGSVSATARLVRYTARLQPVATGSPRPASLCVTGLPPKFVAGRQGMAGLASERVEPRLTAILAVDVVGYSRLMGADEEGTLARLKAHRRELVDPKIAEHRGRIVKTTGDGSLAEFASVVDAMRCAVEFQRKMAGRTPASRLTGVSNSASGSISATSSAKRTTFSATASTSRPGSKPWPNRAGSASTASCATRLPSRSRIWASSRSRTSRGRCGPSSTTPLACSSRVRRTGGATRTSASGSPCPTRWLAARSRLRRNSPRSVRSPRTTRWRTHDEIYPAASSRSFFDRIVALLGDYLIPEK
jgi:hypothetical protein